MYKISCEYAQEFLASYKWNEENTIQSLGMLGCGIFVYYNYLIGTTKYLVNENIESTNTVIQKGA